MDVACGRSIARLSLVDRRNCLSTGVADFALPKDSAIDPENCPLQLPPVWRSRKSRSAKPSATTTRYECAEQPIGEDAVADVTLEYDLSITKTQLLHVTPIWPANVSQKDVKVAFGLPKSSLRLSDESLKQQWKERSIEVVPARSSGVGKVRP